MIYESSVKTCVFTFGRMNPPTIGHKFVMEFMSKLGKKNHCDVFVFLSHTQDKKKNPLDYETKYKYASMLCPRGAKVVHSDCKTVCNILDDLFEKGYSHFIFVCGSDRIESFEKMFASYQKFNPNITYTMESSGDRNEKSDNAIISMSASRMREYVRQGDIDSFIVYSPFDYNISVNLFNQLKENLDDGTKKVRRKKSKI